LRSWSSKITQPTSSSAGHSAAGARGALGDHFDAVAALAQLEPRAVTRAARLGPAICEGRRATPRAAIGGCSMTMRWPEPGLVQQRGQDNRALAAPGRLEHRCGAPGADRRQCVEDGWRAA
jgi:hypothetical protein